MPVDVRFGDMSKRRTVGWWIRVPLLMAAMLWAVVMFQWSRQDDPRFYRFLNSKPGRMVSQVFRWHGSALNTPIADKPESQMNDEERAVKRQLEEDLKAATSAHELVLKDGRTLTGRVEEENPDYVLFTESYGDNGSLSVKIQRQRIRRIDRVSVAPPPVVYRDVRLKMEFPGMNFYKRPPYSIVTDESFFSVEHTVRILQDLYSKFLTVFAPLIEISEERGKNIQLVFFSNEEAYRQYQNKYAPQMENSSGFYSPWVDRLIVFNQKSSEQIRNVQEMLERQESYYRSMRGGGDYSAKVDAWKKDAQKNIARFAEEQTMTSIRHEGAHQLMFTYGVHSRNRVENEWIVEGLASYCEVPSIGDYDPIRVALLKKALEDGTVIPLEKLVNFRSVQGLTAIGSPERAEMAYHEAWALVHWLMQYDHQERFFEYIRFVRDMGNYRQVRKTPAYDLLCQMMQIDPTEFENLWKQHVQNLP